LQLAPDAAIIDVGGGASSLAGRLIARGFVGITVLDVSARALESARAELVRTRPACTGSSTTC